MTILQFMQNFTDEESCETYIKESREKLGYTVKRVNPLPDITGSAEESSLNAPIVGGVVLLKVEL